MPLVDNFSNLILDDAYMKEQSNPPAIVGAPAGIVGVVGVFHQGIPGEIYSVGSYRQAVDLLGKSDLAVGGPLALRNLLMQGVSSIRAVPVFGVGGAAASVTLYDSQVTPQALGTLTAAQANPRTGVMQAMFGDGPNSWTAIVTQPSTPNGTFTLKIVGRVTETFANVTPSNWVATVNATSTQVIAAAAASPSANVAAAGTFAFAGGSLGSLSSGAEMDAAFIGAVDATTGVATGLQALATLGQNGINILVPAEYSSTAVNTAFATFASSNDCIAVLCATDGSTVGGTQAQSTNVQDNVVFVDGWESVTDPDLLTARHAAPSAIAAGVGASLNPWEDWGNKRIRGVLGVLVPRVKSDLETLQQAGILCLTDTIPAGRYPGTRSGVASDGSRIVVRRMKYWLEFSILGAMGWAVDRMQSSGQNDLLRFQVRHAVSDFLEGLKNPANPADQAIDDYSVVCDTTNNTPATIAAGVLRVDVAVRQLSTAKWIEFNVDISPSTVPSVTVAA